MGVLFKGMLVKCPFIQEITTIRANIRLILAFYRKHSNYKSLHKTLKLIQPKFSFSRKLCLIVNKRNLELAELRLLDIFVIM